MAQKTKNYGGCTIMAYMDDNMDQAFSEQSLNEFDQYQEVEHIFSPRLAKRVARYSVKDEDIKDLLFTTTKKPFNCRQVIMSSCQMITMHF
jgi:hypothetical protein